MQSNNILKLVPVFNGTADFITRHLLITGIDQAGSIVPLNNSNLTNYEKLYKSFIQFPENKSNIDLVTNCILSRNSLVAYFESLDSALFSACVSLIVSSAEGSVTFAIYIDGVLYDTLSIAIDNYHHKYSIVTEDLNFTIVFDQTPTSSKFIHLYKYQPTALSLQSKGRFIDTNLFSLISDSDTTKPQKRSISGTNIKQVLAIVSLDLL